MATNLLNKCGLLRLACGVHAVRYSCARFFLALPWMFFSVAAFSAVEQVAPLIPAETIPSVIKYSGIYDTALEAEYAFYNAWIARYSKVSCGFSQLTWIEIPTAVNGYIPFSSVCGYGHILPVVIAKTAVCPTATTYPEILYIYNSANQLCERPAVCPVPTVKPEVPYIYNATTAMCERSISDCPVSDLPLITDLEVQAFEDNPNTSDTARLTPRMQTALQCLLDRDSTATVGSAYRPPAYNQHLIEVWRKWVDQLVENENLACADLKAKIRGHFQRHSLLESQRPVPGSLHTQGEAVDVTINLPAANIDELAAGCQLRRPLPVNDRVHFIHQ